jgi:MFS superfamily sulfate permease-like transporter
MSRRYDRRDLPGDLFAGLTLWAVFAAQALAYARLAHATPTAGLVTAIAGAGLYTALGSSRRISIGPAGGIAAMVGAAVAGTAAAKVPHAVAAVTLMAAGLLLGAGLARISFLTRLFPAPVFVGYIAGTGVTIIIGQGRDLLASGHLGVLVGASAMVMTLLLKKLAPRVPGPFVVLLAATLASVVLQLGGRGVPVIGSALGHFGTFTLPVTLAWSDVRPLIAPALSIGLITYVDALANADLLAQPGDPPVAPRREYFALGTLNALSALFGGFMAGCSTSRSLLALRSGEKTRLAPTVAAVLLLLTALSVVRFLAPMPLPALAGVVLIAAIDLIDVHRLREFWRLRRPDLLTALCAGVGVVWLGMIKGVLVGVAAALFEALRRAMYPDRSVVSMRLGPGRFYEPFTPEAVRASGDVLIYRFGSELFFGNADAFRDDMRAIAKAATKTANGAPRTILLNCDTLGVPDATAREMLLRVQRELGEHGIRLLFGNTRAALREALAKVGAFTLVDEATFVTELERHHPLARA